MYQPPPIPMQAPLYQSQQQQPIIVHNHHHYGNSIGSDDGYRGTTKAQPNITIGYELHNPDGTTEITTQPPPPPQPATRAASVGVGNVGGFFGNSGYEPLTNDTPNNHMNNNNNNNIGYNNHNSNNNNRIEMEAYPMGDLGNRNNDILHQDTGYQSPQQNVHASTTYPSAHQPVLPTTRQASFTDNTRQSPFQSPYEAMARGQTPSERSNAYYGIDDPPAYQRY